MNPAKNCLSFWFPLLEQAGVPVPRTAIVRTPPGCALIDMLGGKTPQEFAAFLGALQGAVALIGGGQPVFLRTGEGAGKHQWRRTCCVTDANKLADHVAALVEWSECVDFLGLPTNVWCVREMLPVQPLAILPCYGAMPLVREVRAFIDGAGIICKHMYWPIGAIEEGFPDGTLSVQELDRLVSAMTWNVEEDAALDAMLTRVVEAMRPTGEAWSVDILDTDRGWFVTDMALADQSFHWPECQAWARRQTAELAR